MFQYTTIPVTAFQQNCSLVWCDETLEAAVIDPGGDLDRVEAEVKKRGLKLTQIWLTHAHIDHAGGTATLAERFSLPIVGPHPGDQFWIDGLPAQSVNFGFPPAGHFTPTRWLKDGDTVRQIVSDIYEKGRSQFGHGGRPALIEDLPVSRATADSVAARALDLYLDRLRLYGGDDDIDVFLAALPDLTAERRKQRQAAKDAAEESAVT